MIPVSSRVPQKLFDAACAVPALEFLWVKWSGIRNIEAIPNAPDLRYFHLGSSTGLNSIEPVSSMTQLEYLGFENIKKISDLGPIASLTQLESLTVEGSMWTTQRVSSLAPISKLRGLRRLSIPNLRSEDKTLRPLLELENLEYLHCAGWWDMKEIRELQRRNPRLLVV
jgi:Leucine-rich repeat (LRR) protein